MLLRLQHQLLMIHSSPFENASFLPRKRCSDSCTPFQKWSQLLTQKAKGSSTKTNVLFPFHVAPACDSSRQVWSIPLPATQTVLRCRPEVDMRNRNRNDGKKFLLLGLYCKKLKKACSCCHILYHVWMKSYCAMQPHHNKNNENTERPDFQHHLGHLHNMCFPTSNNCCRVNENWVRLSCMSMWKQPECSNIILHYITLHCTSREACLQQASLPWHFFNSSSSIALWRLCFHDRALNVPPRYLCVPDSEHKRLLLGIELPFYTMYTTTCPESRICHP